MIREYISNLSSIMQNKGFKSEADERKFYIHMTKIIDCLDLEEVFEFEKNGNTFNFHNYYEEPNRLEIDALRKQVMKKVNIIWTQYVQDGMMCDLFIRHQLLFFYFCPTF